MLLPDCVLQLTELRQIAEEMRVTILERLQQERATARVAKAFAAWYHERSQAPWNFDLEMESYCRSDVRVLAAPLSVYELRLPYNLP